ncbi:MAG: hypothetical protein ABR575_11310 [Actinomycetota bacterium]
MKIQATCNTCDRAFILSQIGPDSDAPGRCPFCGAHFARHYTTVLVDTVGAAERAASAFVDALGRLQGIDTGFEIDVEDLLRSMNEQVRGNDMQRAAR